MHRAASLLAVALLAGCLGDAGLDADATLPGVRTTSTVSDRFTCGPLLFAAGCTIVRIESVDSGCQPEVPGYVMCDTVVWWNATSGTLAPGTRLTSSVNGTAGPACSPQPGAPCTVRGNATFRHAFDGPGEEEPWNLTLRARLEGAPAWGEGDFTLEVRFLVRTEPRAATDV